MESEELKSGADLSWVAITTQEGSERLEYYCRLDRRLLSDILENRRTSGFIMFESSGWIDTDDRFVFLEELEEDYGYKGPVYLNIRAIVRIVPVSEEFITRMRHHRGRH